MSGGMLAYKCARNFNSRGIVPKKPHIRPLHQVTNQEDRTTSWVMGPLLGPSPSQICALTGKNEASHGLATFFDKRVELASERPAKQNSTEGEAQPCP